MNELAPAPPIIPVTNEDFVMPASVSQKRFWLLEQMTPGNTALNIPIALELSGPLDIAVLEQALQAIVDRHEILRTRLELIEGEPHQVISSQATITLATITTNGPENDRAARIRLAMDGEAERPIDFTCAPLLRAALLEVGMNDHVLMLTAHHIVSDGWSNGILVRELAAFYNALRLEEEPELAPLAIQYADYVLWQEEWLKTPEYLQQLEYWRGQLSGHVPVLDFPTDFPRQSSQPNAAILESLLLPPVLTESLKRLCQEEGATLFMVFLTAYFALLHRYTGQSRLFVGTTAANRNRAELEPLIGLFANLLILPGEIDGTMSFRDLLARQRDASLAGFAHHEVPFELVVQDLQQRGVPRFSLQTHFLFQRAFMQPATCGELTLRPLHSVSPGSTFELTFGIVERAEGIRLQMEYRTSLYRRETIQRLLLHFQQLLEGAATHPETPLADLALFAEGEREEMEALWAAATTQPDLDGLIAELDRQMDEHLRTGKGTFAKIHLPPGARVAALDEKQDLLPLGIPGPLFLASHGHEPARPLPFWGRNSNEGSVELAGRDSDLVRIQGFRCNRRSLEVQLRAHPDVEDAAVSVPDTGEEAGPIRAAVVLRLASAVTAEELRNWLKNKVTDYLIPAKINFVSAIERDAQGRLALEADPIPAPATAEARAGVPLHALLQVQLLEIWQRLLHTDRLSADSNFFESGGNSFLALRMMIEAGKLAGRELPLSLLLTGATVRDLARHILAGVNAGGADLVAIQTAGTRTPFFFLHGDWVGGGFYCRGLARDLGGDQPFYALPPYHMREERIVTIREMAAHHVAALRRARPHGPYLIGGYCIGATVAIEVARQLTQEGEKVERLILVDPPLWSDAWLRRLWPWADQLGIQRGWSLEKRIALFDRTTVSALRWLRKPWSGKLATVFRRFGWEIEPRGENPQAMPSETGGAEVLEGLDFSTYYMTHRLHRFTAVDVRTVLLFPEATPSARLTEAITRSGLPVDQVTVQTVPGNHTTCITQHTRELAEKMHGALPSLDSVLK